MYSKESILALHQCNITQNSAMQAILTLLNMISLELNKVFFTNNTFRCGMFVQSSSKLTIGNVTFVRNNAKIVIGILNCTNVNMTQTVQVSQNYVNAKSALVKMSDSTIHIHRNLIFENNTVCHNAVLLVLRVQLDVHQDTEIRGNNATICIKLYRSKVNFNGSLTFSNNIGSFFIEASVIVFGDSSIFSNNVQKKATSTYSIDTGAVVYSLGGAISTIWSKIHFVGSVKFCRNKSWKSGGALTVIESQIIMNDIMLLKSNNAEENGGAIYLDHSNLLCRKNCSIVNNKAAKGGGIYAVSSTISIAKLWLDFQEDDNNGTTFSLINNSANIQGGGLSLEANSKFHGPLKENHAYVIEFRDNSSPKGGAIYVDDYSNTRVCSNTQPSTTSCFFQTPFFKENLWKGSVTISGKEGKNTIFGGLLDRCSAKNMFTDFYIEKNLMNGIMHLKSVTRNKSIERMISSEPVKICYCVSDGTHHQVHCENDRLSVKTERGKEFNVTVSAVDQVNSPVQGRIYVVYENNTLLYQSQGTFKGCTNLTLTIRDESAIINDSVNLVLYAEGPCNKSGISKRILRVNLESCACPHGFITDPDCQCNCHPQIEAHASKCDATTSFIFRKGNAWFSYINSSASGYILVYPDCPYDYCLSSPEDIIMVNLNIRDGSDALCAFNRSGLLCSRCKPGLSLSLGSSRCVSCPNKWPITFIVILFGAAGSGVFLVATILIFNLSIAFGSVNGLIFYANILASKRDSYALLSKSNFFSVFIAWINLELGVDTCFYEGMDSYSKVWLLFLYPSYLIGVLAVFVTISRYSSKFTKLIAERNPVATLATIILLSYTKFLRNVIDILSVAFLDFPEGPQKRWLPDATVTYLKGKHVPLFLVGLVIVCAGLTYTFLLFSWQWLLRAPNYKPLRWIRNSRLNSFMEANVACYTPTHRYWTGLLLFARVAHYLETAYNNSNESSASILGTILIAAGLLFLKALSGKVYRNTVIDYLDSLCYLNLLILSVSQLYCQNTNNQKGQIIAVKVSVTVAFVLLVGVLAFHVIMTASKVTKLRMIDKFRNKEDRRESMLNEVNVPTSTEICLSQLESTSKTSPGTVDSGKSVTNSTSESTDSLREPLLI